MKTCRRHDEGVIWRSRCQLIQKKTFCNLFAAETLTFYFRLNFHKVGCLPAFDGICQSSCEKVQKDPKKFGFPRASCLTPFLNVVFVFGSLVASDGKFEMLWG
jgi:hypothetical protein